MAKLIFSHHETEWFPLLICQESLEFLAILTLTLSCHESGLPFTSRSREVARPYSAALLNVYSAVSIAECLNVLTKNLLSCPNIVN